MRQGWRRYLGWAAAALLALVLAGCNGSGGDGAGGDDGSPYQSEGSADDPVEIVVGTIHEGSVDIGTSYYVADVTASSDYSVTLWELGDDADQVLYNDDATYMIVDCFAPWGRITLEFCQRTAQSSRFHVAVDGRYTIAGTAFRIVINPAFRALTPGCSAGTHGSDTNPVAVPDYLRDGYSYTDARVGTTGESSNYQVPAYGARPYQVGLSALTTDINLYVYADDTFQTLLCSVVGLIKVPALACSGTPAGDFLYVKLVSQGAGECLRLSATVNEGTMAGPVTVYPDRPTLGLAATGSSYYAAIVTAGTDYAVSVTSAVGGATLTVYDSDGFEGTTLCTTALAAGTTSCPSPARPSGDRLYLDLDGSDTVVGEQFQLCLGTCR